MKKKLTMVLLPIFALAFIFALASCKNEYAGDYKEVESQEQLANVYQKVENLNAYEQEAMESQTKKEELSNYELVMNAKMSMTMADFDGMNMMEGKAQTTTMYYDYSLNTIRDTKNDSNYIKMSVNGSASGSSMKSSVECWTVKENAYLSISVNAAGKSISKKIKGSTHQFEMDEFIGMISGNYDSDSLNMDLNVSTVLEAMTNSGAKVYVDGNKVKVEYGQEDQKITLYMIINENNTYQIRFELPEQKFESFGTSFTVSETMDLKPTSKGLPSFNENDFETFSGSFEDLFDL